MTRIAIVGAGPAGAGLAFLLAQRGCAVTLIERQRDFAREFRGEVLMPSGLDALAQMGLSDALRQVPHFQPAHLELYFHRRCVLEVGSDPAQFDGRPPLAVSQTALLEAIVARAAAAPGFELRRGTGVRDLLTSGGRITGLRLHDAEGEHALAFDYVIGADGRASAVRRRAGFAVREQAPPMDVVWFKLPPLGDFRGARGYIGEGQLLIAYHSWDGRLQVAWAILKGSFATLRRAGVAAWLDAMAEHVSDDLAAHLRAHRDALDHPFVLDAASDRVERWSTPGALLIGDAAHTMSPVGGQGLNVALRDAIVAANHLVPVLRGGADPGALDDAARAIEAERLPEIRTIQRIQAIPPRVVLARAWWGEPLRRAIGLLLRTGVASRAAGGRGNPFLFGVTPVQLRV